MKLDTSVYQLNPSLWGASVFVLRGRCDTEGAADPVCQSEARISAVTQQVIHRLQKVKFSLLKHFSFKKSFTMKF